MKKKVVSALLSTVMAATMIAGSASAGMGKVEAAGTEEFDTSMLEKSENPIELNVTTTFAGEDGNVKNFQEAVKAYEEATGNTINDMSGTANEAFKARVSADFQTGSESDVLFYFNGVDSNEFVEAGKVMSIDEIREKYPEYASNMDDGRMGASPVDGKNYSVPVNGYWEALFVNTTVLEDCGIEVPGKDYTWDQFLADCETIKEKGYAPIAAALGNVPHYWWEYSIFNNDTLETHLNVPASVDDEAGKAWVAGLNDIKDLYDKGYFPENTLSALDEETIQLFMEDKAAFLVDGSWRVNGLATNCQSDPNDPSTLDTEKLDKFSVTYFPAKEGSGRKSTDLLGGLSEGYFISRNAWEDEEKQAAAVKFVEYMSSDAMVARFAQHTASALKAAPDVDKSQFNNLQLKAMDMVAGVTSLTAVVQDLVPQDCRTPMFDTGMPSIVTGDVTPEDAVQQSLDLIAEKAAQ